MALSPGSRLGAYEVVGIIGAGGMGEVYRARDTKLNRDVALKVLPDVLAGDADRLSRFRREAQLLASLNHPNIGAIHGLEDNEGVHALVLELIEGPTLADRLAVGPIAVDEALKIAQQICDALEAAHEQGVVHRDLKPSNIKIRPDDTVKVLDFGLAKLGAVGDAASGSVKGAQYFSMSPTMTSPAMTQMGVILGTAAYMAPEQARGRAVDKRADIWAFGCVLFEMITGKRPFDGEDVAETIGAVIHKEVPWAALPAGTPAVVRTVLQRCLEKDPRQRIRDIGDVRLALDGAFATPAGQEFSPALPPSRTPVSRLHAVWLAAACGAGALIAGAGVWFATRPAPLQPIKLTVPAPPGEIFGLNVNGSDLVIAPDGRRIVFTTGKGNQRRIYVRPLDQLVATQLGTTTSVDMIFLSPDGQWVGYTDIDDRSLKKISITGGSPVTICKLGNVVLGASWGVDDVITFDSTAAGATAGGLWQVPAAGGTPRQITKPDVEKGELRHRHPKVLPGGETVLFDILPTDNQLEGSLIVAQNLNTGQRKILVRGGSNPEYASGQLLFAVAGTLRAARFDLERLEVEGNPVPVLEDVVLWPNGTADFALAPNGTLVYLRGSSVVSEKRQLVWVDRQGKEEPIPAPARAYAYVRVSPDGSRLALDVRDQQNDIWVWDLSRKTMTRLTFDPNSNRGGIWSPDGRRVAFSIAKDGTENVYWQVADGSSPPEALTTGKQLFFPTAFSPDAKRLLASQVSAPYDIFAVQLDGDRRVEALLNNQNYDEQNGEISPDGRWLAYQSTESGRAEIYVRPFPGINTARWQVSTGGGARPAWARNSRELFYMAQGALMAVPIQSAATFVAGTPQMLFKSTYEQPFGGRAYDVSPDGKRFVMFRSAEAVDVDATPRQLTVVQHWTTELERIVPKRKGG